MRFVEGAPIFAAEVRSESDYGNAADRSYQAKRADYFAADTQVVWDVNPVRQTIFSYVAGNPTTRPFSVTEILRTRSQRSLAGGCPSRTFLA